MKRRVLHHTKKAKFNFKPGLTVGLVSIPLSISLAVASGVSPIVGIVSAFWGGAVASLFGGSIYNIIGPTGALSGLVLSFTLTYGLKFTPELTILAGLFVLIAWALNFHKYLIYIPGAVIHGFTLGIAFVIGLGQINNALGLRPTVIHENLLLNTVESVKLLQQAQLPSVLLFIFSLFGLLVSGKKWPRLPAAIGLSLIGIAVGYLTTFHYLPFIVPTLFSKFGQLTLNLIPSSFPAIAYNPRIFQAASVIAFIAIIETMLSAKVANVITKTRFGERKEMLALALANISSGLVGGIPVTAALARTSLNIKSGANSKLSGIISAITIGFVSIALFSYFQYLPLAVIAAILIHVAINMAEKEHFKFLRNHDIFCFAISMVVAILTIIADPLIAVVIGSVAMLLRQIQRISAGDYELILNKNKKLTHRLTGKEIEELDHGHKSLIYSFTTDLTYFNSDPHMKRLEHISKKTQNIILRFRSVSYIDADGILMLEELIETFEKHGVSVYFSGLSERVRFLFTRTAFLNDYIIKGRVYENTVDALTYLHNNNFKKNVRLSNEQSIR